jgi:hypothetical protein
MMKDKPLKSTSDVGSTHIWPRLTEFKLGERGLDLNPEKANKQEIMHGPHNSWEICIKHDNNDVEWKMENAQKIRDVC